MPTFLPTLGSMPASFLGRHHARQCPKQKLSGACWRKLSTSKPRHPSSGPAMESPVCTDNFGKIPAPFWKCFGRNVLAIFLTGARRGGLSEVKFFQTALNRRPGRWNSPGGPKRNRRQTLPVPDFSSTRRGPRKRIPVQIVFLLYSMQNPLAKGAYIVYTAGELNIKPYAGNTARP